MAEPPSLDEPAGKRPRRESREVQSDLCAAPSTPASRLSTAWSRSSNSLDNQREASEAYVKSQAHEGWKLIRTRYDDGGYSGGSMEKASPRAAAGRCSRSPDRRDHCLQGRPADPLARRLRQTGRAPRRPSSVVRLGHPSVQHHDQHGTIDPECPFILRPVRARGHW